VYRIPNGRFVENWKSCFFWNRRRAERMARLEDEDKKYFVGNGGERYRREGGGRDEVPLIRGDPHGPRFGYSRFSVFQWHRRRLISSFVSRCRIIRAMQLTRSRNAVKVHTRVFHVVNNKRTELDGAALRYSFIHKSRRLDDGKSRYIILSCHFNPCMSKRERERERKRERERGREREHRKISMFSSKSERTRSVTKH